VAVPKEALHGPLRRSLLSVSAAAAVLLALTAAAAWWLANTLSRQITGAVAAVAALGNGTEPPTAEGSIRELAAIGHSVAHVKQREMRAGLALADAIVETEQVKAELASARHDQLTGLPSRALFLELTEAATRHSSRSDSRMAVLFVDLDGFKRVNDEKGHQRGDEVLAETAAILRNVVRGSDSCGRLGGDEFAICLTADTATIDSADTATINDIAVAVAGRIVEQVAGIGDGIGCSIGIAICPPGPVDLAAALRQADAAMYDAKRQGKNRFSIYR
jgi:diguanylate cyclase (GGDEF)-like protein